MVQPAAPYSCILAPAFAWGTAMCQPVYDLIHKISVFVSSIFMSIGEFVKGWLWGASVTPTATHPAALVVTIQSVAPSASQSVAPAVELVTTPFPEPAHSDKGLQKEKELLRTLVNRLCNSEPISRNFIDENMETSEKAKNFFARLVGYFGVMDPTTRHVTQSLISKIEGETLQYDIYTYFTNLQGLWDRVASPILSPILRDHFLETTPAGHLEAAGRVLALLDGKVEQFIQSSTLFNQCADALREEYRAIRAIPSIPRASPSPFPPEDAQYCIDLFDNCNNPNCQINLDDPSSLNKFFAQSLVGNLALLGQNHTLPHFMRQPIVLNESSISAAPPRRSGGIAYYHGQISALAREFKEFSFQERADITFRYWVTSLESALAPSDSVSLFLRRANELASSLMNNQKFLAAAETARQYLLERNRTDFLVGA